MKKHTRFIYIVICILALGITQCGFDGSSSATIDTDLQDLTETELDALDTGPATLPVTISKLEAIDQNLTTARHETINSSINSLSKYSTSDAACTGGVYIITGAAGAADTTYDSVYAFNTATEVATTANIADDGSFEICIPADKGDYVALAVQIDDETIGIPVYITHQDGVTTFTSTNTSSLQTSSIPYDDGEAYFLQLINSDEVSFNLYRKTWDGLTMELVAENLDAPVTTLDVNGNDITFATQTGSIYVVSGTTSASSSSASLTTSSGTYATTWGEPQLITSTTLTASDQQGHYYLNAEFSGTGDIFLTNSFYDGSAQGDYILKLLSSDGSETVLEGITNYEAAFFADYSNKLYGCTRLTGAADINCYDIDLSDGSSAWTNRNFVYNLSGLTGSLTHIEANSNFILAMTQNETILINISAGTQEYIINGNTIAEMSDYIATPYGKISPSGDYIATLIRPRNPATTELSVYIALHRVGIDAANVFFLITAIGENTATEWSYGFGDGDRIPFYDYNLSTEEPQISLVDPTILDFDDLTQITFTTGTP